MGQSSLIANGFTRKICHCVFVVKVDGAYLLPPNAPIASGKPATEKDKLVEVWKKQGDGNWKTVADIFNSGLPVPAPAEVNK